MRFKLRRAPYPRAALAPTLYQNGRRQAQDGKRPLARLDTPPRKSLPGV
jgi:hypothetical protein